MEKSQLGSLSVKQLMCKLAVPAITAQLINLLYNIVDRIYIGHIGHASALSLTGVGLCFPVIAIISAFSLLAGLGGAPLVAMELGKAENGSNSKKKAELVISNALLMLLFFSVCLTSFFLLCKTPVLKALGASSDTLPYARAYLSVYLTGTLFVQLSLGLNPFITSQGFARTAMISVLVGAVANVILDPIFIFTLKLGVKGAAIATVISQALSALWIIVFLCSKKSLVRIRLSSLVFDKDIVAEISFLGISPFIMNATEGAIFVIFNSNLQRYGGDMYVGAMTILQCIMQLVFVPLSGFTSGVQPVISYNYGADKIDRVKLCVKYMLIVCVSFCVMFNFILTVFCRQVASVFTTNSMLIDLVVKIQPVYFGSVWFFGVQMCAQSTFVGLGRAKISVFIALLRKIILLIPLALILPCFVGVMGIYAAEPVASITSAFTSGVLLWFVIKDL